MSCDNAAMSSSNPTAESSNHRSGCPKEWRLVDMASMFFPKLLKVPESGVWLCSAVLSVGKNYRKNPNRMALGQNVDLPHRRLAPFCSYSLSYHEYLSSVRMIVLLQQLLTVASDSMPDDACARPEGSAGER